MKSHAFKKKFKNRLSDVKTFSPLNYKQNTVATNTNALADGYIKSDAKYL